MRNTLLLALAWIGAGWMHSALAQGLIVPSDTDVPPLALRSHRVTAEISSQGAVTTVEQVFENNTERQLEARYVFPIPRGAAISKFTMLVNGVAKTGEMVEKGKARQIYNAIVSRAQDPGLLEHIGQDLFQANIFPILPRSTQRISVTYLQVLAREGELVAYHYPLRAGERRAAKVRNEFTLEVNLKSPAPIRSIYSPSHSILVSRTSEREAEVRFEQNQAVLEKDFQLFYSVSEKEVGLNLVTYRPDGAKPGYFMLLISPKSKLQAEELVKRDLVFVIDSSHSMEGQKIAQAREALKYCVKNLNAGDRFNIVNFSTDVEAWRKSLVEADPGNRKAALEYLETIEPTGGTNIDGALKAALSFQKKEEARPYIVIFMTDGKPTVGAATDARTILSNQLAWQSDAGKNVRIFTWGVGYDLDTHLLDQMAENGGGVSEYVKPQEDIATKLAAFYNKASRPVLTGLQLEVLNEKIQLVNCYPKKLPDLYAGSQLLVMGQYIGAGAVAIKLSGQVNERSEQFTYEMDFPALDGADAFVQTLWAKRRIGHLLDTIRLNGESKELVDDVIRLSKEHGIQTPYTSYLVLEDGTPVPAKASEQSVAGLRRGSEDRLRVLASKAKAEWDREDKRVPQASAPATPAGSWRGGGMEGAEEKAGRAQANELAKDLATKFAQADGQSGVAVSDFLKKLKHAGTAGEQHAAIFKKAGETRFFAYHELWVDERYETACALTPVKFASAAYFLLLERHPELVEAFKLGKTLICVVAPGKALLISASGAEQLTEEQIVELFKR